jgi:hypothetical protein
MRKGKLQAMTDSTDDELLSVKIIKNGTMVKISSYFTGVVEL